MRIASTIKIPEQPVYVIFDSGTQRLYVSEPIANRLHVLNPTSGALDGAIGVGDYPGSVIHLPQRQMIITANRHDASLSIIDIAGQPPFVSSLSVAAYPKHIFASPDQRKLIITHTYNGSVTFVDLDDVGHHSHRNTVFVGTRPLNAVFHADSDTALVVNRRSISLVDCVRYRVIAHCDMEYSLRTIAISETTGEAFVVCPLESAVCVLDSRGQFIKTITVERGPITILPLHGGRRFCVLCAAANSAVIIDSLSKTCVDRVAVGDTPMKALEIVEGGLLLVLNFGDKTMSIVDRERLVVLDTCSVGKRPFGLAVVPFQRKAYVANEGTHWSSKESFFISAVPLDDLWRTREPQIPTQRFCDSMPLDNESMI